jgi:hypothetical protein
MRNAAWWLTLASAVTAIFAAAFWFLSAAQAPPPLRTYWDAAPPSDPFFKAVAEGIVWNRLAALFAGISAACTAAATLLQVRRNAVPQADGGGTP